MLFKTRKFNFRPDKLWVFGEKNFILRTNGIKKVSRPSVVVFFILFISVNKSSAAGELVVER